MRVERRKRTIELKMSLQNKGCEMLNAIDGWDGDGLSDAEDMAPTTIEAMDRMTTQLKVVREGMNAVE
ncbi:hypothetical protein L596_016616 [Steinernema carpocapsae]|uniref:Uncharacterized protein n=1 Tax=Steinernema carpocapsae TaxID=34508 RepID=A0A4U5NJA9_STECR|nr:hypothetical protein L596_016603 [Steinernema carpocapsae]TKR82948.1 hypothetical protein L596_016616 [Steinernema carpocapsae]